MGEKYGEFDATGVHIDIFRNRNIYEVNATTLHELTHQELVSNSSLGMLDFLLSNIAMNEHNKKIVSKIEQLYDRD